MHDPDDDRDENGGEHGDYHGDDDERPDESVPPGSSELLLGRLFWDLVFEHAPILVDSRPRGRIEHMFD